MRVSRMGALTIIAALSTACGDNVTSKDPGNSHKESAENHCVASADIAVSDAWIRSSRAGQPTSAAYLTMTNCGKEDDTLISASFDGSGAVELHMTAMTGDGMTSMASMTPTHGVTLPAGETITLEPGGGHIMLIGMTESVVTDSNPVLTLEFEKAATLNITFEVRDAIHGNDHSTH